MKFHQVFVWVVLLSSLNHWAASVSAQTAFQETSLSQEQQDRLEDAGDHRTVWKEAFNRVSPEHRKGLAFLLENMSDPDLKSLSADFLVEHVEGAYEAWMKAPWKSQIDEELFLNGILPYANVSERRDAWRKDFRNRFLPLVEGAKSPGEAAAKLNQTIYGMLDVKYSAQRKKADQSPYESIEYHTASCTGLSILLIDACRSVGVPARFVGTPLWSDRSGNHSWVEVWNDGDWHFTGACEPAGNRLDEGWFIARASEAKVDEPRHAICAVSFKKTPLLFPMVWDRSGARSYAINVTSRYTNKKVELEEGKIRIRLRVIDPTHRQRIATMVTVSDEQGNKLAEAKTRDEGFDTNDHVELVVATNQTLKIRVEGSSSEQTVIANQKDQLITLERMP
ncbi:MAG: transglutaminase-like domain-containing protein [Pirellulales bacterium]